MVESANTVGLDKTVGLLKACHLISIQRHEGVS